MNWKLYIESKIKPTKINKTTVKMFIKEYPILKDIEFFKTKITSTNDTIYILDFNEVELIDIEPDYCYFRIRGKEYKNLTFKKVKDNIDIFYIESNHWKNQNIAQKRQIIALENKQFNIEIDKAVDKTKELIDKLEYRVKKLRKIDWKV